MSWRGVSLALAAAVAIALLALPRASANLAIEPFKLDDISNQTCPDWVAEYVKFHRETRGKPDAKYLTFACNAKFHHCGGLGDRLRGMKFAMKLAYLSSRVLLIDDKKPIPVEAALLPNLIDWRPQGITIDESSFARLVFFSEKLVGLNALDVEVDETVYSDTRFVTVHTDYAYDVVVRNAARPMLQTGTPGDFTLNYGPKLKNVTTEGRKRASCLLRTLFRPHPALIKQFQAQYQLLFNTSAPQRYVAIHFRAGGMKNTERKAIKRTSDNLTALMRSLACARRRAEDSNITAPILLLTDNHALRTSVSSGRLGTNVVTTSFDAVHLDYLRTDTDETLKAQARTVYVDLLLLIGSECLVVPTRSGFSNEATLWGAQSCFVPWVDECFKMPVQEAVKTVLQLPISW